MSDITEDMSVASHVEAPIAAPPAPARSRKKVFDTETKLAETPQQSPSNEVSITEVLGSTFASEIAEATKIASEGPKPRRGRRPAARPAVEKTSGGDVAVVEPSSTRIADVSESSAPLVVSPPSESPKDAPEHNTPAFNKEEDTNESSPGRVARKRVKITAQEDSSKPADRPQKTPRSGPSNNNADNKNRPPQNKNNNNNNHNNNNNNNRNADRRNRRSGYNAPHDTVPQANREELEALKVTELRAKAEELGIDHKGVKKEELTDAVLAALIRAEGFVECSGVLDLLADGYGFLRTHGYLPGEGDVYVGVSTIRKGGLRKGDYITGMVRPAGGGNDKFPALNRIETVNGRSVEESRSRRRFPDLTPIYPDERLIMEHGRNTITARTIDLVAPIGKGQRGLIVSPPKAGKTTILKDIAASITANNPEVHLMCLLVDERPEEVTDMERSICGEVISSTFDMPCENHIAVAELVIERAKRLVEQGADVVILLDSITRLARAYNLAQPASGRVLSGGVDSTALYPPKRFLGAARNIEGGGSLTILASALIDTGSKMDEVIFEEFKGTGNMELKLDRNLADRRIFPAIDPIASGTRKEELLLDPQEAPLIWGVRRVLSNAGSTERAMEMLIKSLKQTEDNQIFLMRAAKKAQEKNGGALEL